MANGCKPAAKQPIGGRVVTPCVYGRGLQALLALYDCFLQPRLNSSRSTGASSPLLIVGQLRPAVPLATDAFYCFNGGLIKIK